MRNVTLISILIALAIGFASVLAVVCCLGIVLLLIKKYVFDGDEEEKSDWEKNKVLPLFNQEEIKDNDYEVILVNSDRNIGTPD